MTPREQLGPKAIERLRDELSGRDLAVIDQVAELRLMTTRHIAAVHFTSEDYPSAVAAARACNRCLDRLVSQRMLGRLERRIGGTRAGSSSYVYRLGPIGQRLLDLKGPRRRFREPSALFVDHTLAVAQFLVNLIVTARTKAAEVDYQAEPGSWRSFTAPGGVTVLRPDAYIALGVGEYEHRYFIEVDRGTEHLPALMRKCGVYEAYYRSGKEQARSGVFPRVCWLMPNAERGDRLRRAIDEQRQLTSELFIVFTNDAAIELLGGEVA